MAVSVTATGAAIVRPMAGGAAGGSFAGRRSVLPAGEERIALERDPFGRRPLYYAQSKAGLHFAATPSALLASGVAPARLDNDAARELLELQFTTGRRTLIEGVLRVLPGETVVALGGRIVERRRQGILPECVDARLRHADAQVRLAALSQSALGRTLGEARSLAVFDLGTPESRFLIDALRREGRRDTAILEIAPESARTADPARIAVPIDGPAFLALVPAVAAALDDPATDYSAVALFALARAAAPLRRLVVTGHGGAELFAGHGRYRSILRPVWLGGRAMRRRGFLEGLGLWREEDPSWRDGLHAMQARIGEQALTPLQAAQALDCALWLPNGVLAALDRCLARHGLEGRTPWLDPALAGFAFTLPDRLKIAHGQGSALLRRALGETGRAPRRSAERLPVVRWIAEAAPALGPRVARQAGVASLCRPDAVEGLYRHLAHRPAKRLGLAAWQLLFFALWHRAHIEGKVPHGDAIDVLS